MSELFNYTPSAGSYLYSPTHCLWLITSAGLMVWAVLSGRRNPRTTRAIGLTLLLAEFFRVLALYFSKTLDKGFLPLHLCGVALYITAIHAATDNDLLGELIFSTLAPGSLTALLFPDWIQYPPTSFLFLSSFGIHALLCAYSGAMLASGRHRPSIRRLPLCFGLLLGYAALVYLIDRLLSVNYLFLIYPAKGSPLEWFGRYLPWYALGYIPALLLVWAFLYGAWFTYGFMHKRMKK